LDVQSAFVTHRTRQVGVAPAGPKHAVGIVVPVDVSEQQSLSVEHTPPTADPHPVFERQRTGVVQIIVPPVEVGKQQLLGQSLAPEHSRVQTLPSP
jgi:hypothetical protein